MPRSNKKRNPLKPPLKHPPSLDQQSSAISHLMTQERQKMISRAIASGKKHGINLEHGSPIPGLGDCAFDSVIQNNNARSCFREKLTMPINYYRKIWMTDMANRTVNSPWNIYTSQEWLAGWEQMLIPGAYERGIYGDLMLPGIACGIRKFVLIFNTDLLSPHDPIYVVDPRKFDIEADSDIPIVLSYNLSHYESMHPCNNDDILKTTQLVQDYLFGRYSFSRSDLPFLLRLDNEHLVNERGRPATRQQFSKDNEYRKSLDQDKITCDVNKTELKISNLNERKKSKFQKTDDVFERNSNKKLIKPPNRTQDLKINPEDQTEIVHKNECTLDDEIDLVEIDEFFDSMNRK